MILHENVLYQWWRRYRSCADRAEVEIARGDPDGFYRRKAAAADDDGGGVGRESSPVCDLLDVLVGECAPILRPCYPREEEYLAFRDTQVSVFIQFTSTLYGLGEVVLSCTAAQESLARSSSAKSETGQQGGGGAGGGKGSSKCSPEQMDRRAAR